MPNQLATDAPQPLDGVALRRLAPAAYLVALGMLGPLIATQVTMWDPGSPINTTSWRYAMFGVIINSQFYLMVALVIAAAAAAGAMHTKALSGAAAIGVIAGLFIVVGTPLFLLDILQLRQGVRPDLYIRLRRGAIQAAGQAVLAFPVFLLIVVGCWRARRAIRTSRASQTRSASPRVIGGQ